MPTQQYFSGAYKEETVQDITTKTRQRKKLMTWTSKEEVEGSFNLTKPANNTMHTFFYSNISEFGGYFEGVQSIISRFCQIEVALNFFFTGPSH